MSNSACGISQSSVILLTSYAPSSDLSCVATGFPSPLGLQLGQGRGMLVPGWQGQRVDQPWSILLSRWEESSTFPHPGQLAQKWVDAKPAAVTQLLQKSNSATSPVWQNNLHKIQLSSQSPLLSAVRLSQQQCLRTTASPSTHLYPCSPASQRCTRHIFKATWIWGHQS